MKLITTISLLSLLIASVLADTVSFDSTYDNAGQSLDTVACSDGPNGLITKGFNKFGDLPTFPSIGGSEVVRGFNDINCGSCWVLSYKGNMIHVTIIDHADHGFNIGKEAMNSLTGGQADFLGRIEAKASQVPASECGL